MTPEHLTHRLSPAERDDFNEQGYLIVDNALDATMTHRLLAAVERIDARERTAETRDKLLSVPNIVHEDPAFVNLVDWPTTFPKVWGILGWNIYLYHSHADITPPADAAALKWRVAWHQDSMRVNDEIESHPRPRLSLKIGFYLTDTSEPERGNTLLVPGSHLADEIDCPADGVSNPAGAVPVCVKPGAALILDRRTWHSRSPNFRDQTRKVVWFGYAYRWLRPKDEMTVAHLYPSLDPVRKQLLGGGLSANGTYDPTDGDVPLRTWLREHCSEERGVVAPRPVAISPPGDGPRQEPRSAVTMLHLQCLNHNGRVKGGKRLLALGQVDMDPAAQGHCDDQLHRAESHREKQKNDADVTIPKPASKASVVPT